ncbi:tetratricopeptide repeat protein [Rubripirellula lacrimiformis]|uniref:Tetratricopeptide repeat protein n=1 Tax=Rubripirellula lacrimiformis TaxID=1930273 RepID=A0A517NLM1_9BACT|nr:tetratricopeptide repeat protein [Rubripirellula lacrimiformis]QDT08031.1 tetratricopeptide repeat protein [Rubripirellula lacrimiformis]
MAKRHRKNGSGKEHVDRRQPPGEVQNDRKRRSVRTLVAAVLATLVVIAGMLWWIPGRHIQHAEQAIGQWRFQKAQQHLADYPAWGMDRGRVYYLLARVARQQDGYALAQEHLRTATSGGFDRQAVQRERDLLDVQNGDLNPALLQKLEIHLDQAPDDRPAIYEAYALGHAGLGQTSSAIDLLDRWIEQFPSDGRPYYWKGFIDLRSDDEDSALTMFTESARRDHALVESHLGKAQILSNRSQDGAALVAYQDALESAPERWDIRIQMAETLWRMQRQSDAVRILEPIARSDASVYPAGRRLAQYYSLQHQPDDVISTLTPMLKFFPEDASLNYLLADALTQKSQHDRAGEAMDRFYRANSVVDTLRYARSEVIRQADPEKLASVASTYRQFDWVKARDWLETATKVLPANPLLHRQRSEVLRENGFFDAATREQNIADTQSL